MSKKTSIIILTLNQLKYTKMCLESIKTSTILPYELIIVDNGSTDKTVQYLKSLDNVKLITNKSNLGYGIGVNQGIKAASGEFILLLNNDTLVFRNWLGNQIRCLTSKEEIGIVGPKSNYAGGSQGGIKGNFNTIKKIREFSLKFNKTDPQRWFETDLIVGFCMLIKREVIDDIGLFDQRFTYGMFEDNDFCRRARMKGYKLYCAGDTFVYHFGSKSFQGNQLNMGVIFTENRKRFNQKWGLE